MTDTSYGYDFGNTVPTAPQVPTGIDYRRHQRRSAIFWGVMLVVLGLAFMLGQFVPGLYWWMLWPLLFVVGGFAQMVTPNHNGIWSAHRIFEGFGTVLFGGVLLGCTTGVISWSVWWTLLTLWPVLIIALGVSILGRGIGAEWLRAASHVVVWLALFFAVSVSFTGAFGFYPNTAFAVWTPAGTDFAITEPAQGVREATLDLTGAAGELTVTDGDALVSAKGTSAFGTPVVNVTRDGDAAQVTIGPGNHPTEVWPGVGGTMKLALSDAAVWDGTISTGATSLDADLSDVHVRDLTLKSGASSATLKLGEVPTGVSQSELAVKSGVSAVTVLVPSDVEARVVSKSGLSGMDVGSRFHSEGGGVYQTEGYSENGVGWDISVESGVGSVSVKSY